MIDGKGVPTGIIEGPPGPPGPQGLHFLFRFPFLFYACSFNDLLISLSFFLGYLTSFFLTVMTLVRARSTNLLTK